MKNKKTLLIGGGGHARSIVESFGAARFAGYVALTPAEYPISLPYEGDDRYVTDSFSPEEFDIHIAVGFTSGASLRLRRHIIELYQAYNPVTLIASSAVVTPSSRIGAGSAVMAGVIVNRADIGRHCVINTGAIIEHDCTLQSNVFIGPGAILCGEVRVGHDVFIGAGAVIREGLTIPDGTIIAMGAVVTSSPDSDNIWAGNPATPLSSSLPTHE